MKARHHDQLDKELVAVLAGAILQLQVPRVTPEVEVFPVMAIWAMHFEQSSLLVKVLAESDGFENDLE